MSYPNPVRGVIQAKGEKWKGTPVYRQVRTAADHKAVGQGYANDYGNGRGDVDPALAVAAGKVIRVDNAEGIVVVENATNRFGYAHMRSIRTAVGRTVAVGDQLGVVSDAHSASIPNFSGPHLHFAIWKKVINRTRPAVTWEPVDPWPLLAQNELPDTSTGDDVKLKGTPIEPGNWQTTLTAGLKLVADPTAAQYEVLADLAAGTTVTVDWRVRGKTILGTDEWYGCWVLTPPTPQFGYISKGGCGPLIKPAGGGFTQDDLDDSYNAGRSAVQAAAAGVPPR